MNRWLLRATVLTVAAGLLGIPTGIFDFPSFPSSLASIGWKVGMLAILLVGAQVFDGRRPSVRDLGIQGEPKHGRALPALATAAAMAALAFFWDAIPGLSRLPAAGDAASYEAGMIGGGLLAFELLVRYPIGVLSEELFFRGYLQSRLTVAAPVVTGFLFAAFHMQQWQTIPSLVPFGIALGVLRWWLGTIWPGVAVHYAGNAIFILSLR